MSWELYKAEIYDKWSKKWLESHPKEIGEYSWNYLFTGGKQIRPKLFCELWNYLSPGSKILAELAFAIECIHVSSIVLDDTPWMDNASERRGKATLHTVFSPKKAVLISYDLLDIATEIWKNNRPEHITVEVWGDFLKTKLQKLIIGQWYDLEKKGTLVELSSLKTGVLFELVTETVALCIGLDPEFWKIWGNNLGILFQWMDDFLDMEEDKEQQNRNAFNESYDITLKNYSILW
jgi:geranylgeranyl pyrophosphate synthase